MVEILYILPYSHFIFSSQFYATLSPFQVTWLPMSLSNCRRAVLIRNKHLETCMYNAGTRDGKLLDCSGDLCVQMN